MTRFERHQRFLTRGVMSPDIAEREAIAKKCAVKLTFSQDLARTRKRF